jgi:hypothetical protein
MALFPQLGVSFNRVFTVTTKLSAQPSTTARFIVGMMQSDALRLRMRF